MKQTNILTLSYVLNPKVIILPFLSADERNKKEKYFFENYKEDEAGLARKAQRDSAKKEKTAYFYLKFFPNQTVNLNILPLQASKTVVLDKEFKTYLSCTINSMEEEGVEGPSLLEWWKARRSIYPNLFRMACECDVLSVQASSTPSEHLFSKVGLFLGKDRAKFEKKNLRRAFCLSEYMKCAIKFV
jgi:hypothetical protein